MTVGEALGVTLEQTPLLVDERRNELNMIFHFDLVRLDRQGWRWKPWTLPEFKAICARFDEGLDCHSWPTVYLTNHDNPRSVSHFCDDSPEPRQGEMGRQRPSLPEMNGCLAVRNTLYSFRCLPHESTVSVAPRPTPGMIGD
jgi:glycosidase